MIKNNDNDKRQDDTHDNDSDNYDDNADNDGHDSNILQCSYTIYVYTYAYDISSYDIYIHTHTRFYMMDVDHRRCWLSFATVCFLY